MNNIIEYVAELDKSELALVVELASEKLKKFRPMSINTVFKKCSKKTCSCRWGAVAEYGHGPYLVATYTENKKRKQKNLGKWLSDSQIEALYSAESINWWDYPVTDRKFENMSDIRKWECFERRFTDSEFMLFHKLDSLNDYSVLLKNRIDKMRYDSRKFHDAVEQNMQAAEVGSSEYRDLGISKMASVEWLRMMEEKGYYLK